MKTKFLKMGVPLMVCLLGVVFAFATEKNESMDDTLVTGYIFKDGICQSVPMDCNGLSAVPCEYENSEVHRINNLTFCSEVLYHRPD